MGSSSKRGGMVHFLIVKSRFGRPGAIGARACSGVNKANEASNELSRLVFARSCTQDLASGLSSKGTNASDDGVIILGFVRCWDCLGLGELSDFNFYLSMARYRFANGKVKLERNSPPQEKKNGI